MSSLPETVAAVDLGSNSFHMLLARLSDGQPTVIDRLREMIQIASGLDESKYLDEEAQERALACLRRFGQRLRPMQRSAIRAVGTNTLRSARNVAEFLPRAEEALGHPIETISGIEEARLIYLGVSHSMPRSDARRLVIDIGGGSTELIIGEGFQPLNMESLYVGCVTVSRRFFRDGKLDAKRWKKASLAVESELAHIESNYRSTGWEQAVGSSGTIRAAGAVIRALPGTDDAITPANLERLRELMLAAGQFKRVKLEGLSAQRRRYFHGGIVVLQSVMRVLGIDRIEPSDGALREGLLYDLLGRIREEDVRARTVKLLADRCHVDLAQASRVESTVRNFLTQVEEDWHLEGREPRNLIAWASLLHETGLDIAHSQYHRHGEYIIAHADLPGFSFQDQRLLGFLVRAHRRKFPGAVAKTLPSGEVRRAERLAALLRLAVLLHRSRSPAPLPEIRVGVQKRALRLRFPEGWLDDHPLTRADLEQEAGYLASVPIRLTFD